MATKKRRKSSHTKPSTTATTHTTGWGQPLRPKRRKKQVKKSRAFSVIVVIGLAALAFAALHIDGLVRQRTAQGALKTPSALLSEPTSFAAYREVPLQRFIAELRLRNYRRSEDTTLRPGEFLQTSDGLLLFPRTSLRSDGVEIVGKQKLLAISGAASDDASVRIPEDGLSLEPIILARLAHESARADTFTPISKIPPHVIDAVISIEDERFFDHRGVDVQGILRAIVKNVIALKIVEGGSTITQQLAKNILFSPERSLTRKVKEALAALSLEFHFSKQQLLEMYLNEVYLGQEGAFALHGFGEGARSFFGKRVTELSLAEGALLAGLIKGPSLYSPRRHYNAAMKRKNLVLQKMLALGKISPLAYEKARAARINVLPPTVRRRGVPFFESTLRKALEAQGLPFDRAVAMGARIVTPIHAGIQQCAARAMDKVLPELDRQFGEPGKKFEAALVAIDPASGKVRAYVGGRDFSTSQFDRVSLARRQAGSTVKPFVYVAALDQTRSGGDPFTTLSVLPDKPMSITLPHNATPWQPENFDKQFRGEVTLRYALENSLNLPTVYLSQQLGIKTIVSTFQDFGLADKVPVMPSIALGALDVSLLGLTTSYASLANQGISVTPRVFLNAIDRHGNSLIESPLQERTVVSEGASFVVTNILQGVVERGTAKGLRARGVQGPVAGKTGTSDNGRDSWFIGYTPRLSVGAWVGYDDNSPTRLTGGTGAVPLWAEFYSCATTFFDDDAIEFIPPPSAVFVDVDPRSGTVANAATPADEVVREIFVRGTEPTASSPLVIRRKERKRSASFLN